MTHNDFLEVCDTLHSPVRSHSAMLATKLGDGMDEVIDNLTVQVVDPHVSFHCNLISGLCTICAFIFGNAHSAERQILK